MKPREPYVRKHVHLWKITKTKPAHSGGWDWFTQQDEPASVMNLTRECSDCGERQSADVPDESVLVPGYEAVSGDLEWRKV